MKKYFPVVFILFFITGCKPATESFTSVTDCTKACQENNFDQGDCVLPYETGRDMVNIGQCTIADDSSCQNEGQCQCYCFNNNMISEQFDLILNQQK